MVESSVLLISDCLTQYYSSADVHLGIEISSTPDVMVILSWLWTNCTFRQNPTEIISVMTWLPAPHMWKQFASCEHEVCIRHILHPHSPQTHHTECSFVFPSVAFSVPTPWAFNWQEWLPGIFLSPPCSPYFMKILFWLWSILQMYKTFDKHTAG